MVFCLLVSQLMRKLQKQLPFFHEGFCIKDHRGGWRRDSNLGPSDTSRLSADGTADPRRPRRVRELQRHLMS